MEMNSLIQVELPFEADQLVRHIKSGFLYKVICTSFKEDDRVPQVVYRSQGTGYIWVRPLSEFVEKFEALRD